MVFTEDARDVSVSKMQDASAGTVAETTKRIVADSTDMVVLDFYLSDGKDVIKRADHHAVRRVRAKPRR